MTVKKMQNDVKFEKTTKTEIRFPTKWEPYLGKDWKAWILDAMAEKIANQKAGENEVNRA